MQSIMRFTALITGVILLVVFSAAQLRAQEREVFPLKGTTEIGGSFSFISTTPVVNGVNGDARTTFLMTPSVGYFLSDGFELGVDPFAIRSESGGGATITDVLFLISPAYNFRTDGMVTPYIEGLLGYASTSGGGASANGVSWGLQGGLKLGVTGRSLLN